MDATPPFSPLPPQLSREECDRLSHVAWEAIRALVLIEEWQPPVAREKEPSHGVFVTLRRDGELRGCIGSTRPSFVLSESVAHHARAAASRDPRFPPVRPDELATLAVDITVLSHLEAAPDEARGLVRSILPGRHGLQVVQGEKRGLLLPDVCARYGWDAEEFLRQTCVKADLAEDAWKSGQTDVYLFTAFSFAARAP